MDNFVLAARVFTGTVIGSLFYILGKLTYKDVVRENRKKKGLLFAAKKPDSPFSFGDNMAWIAIRTKDNVHVARTLNLKNPIPSNWISAMGYVFEGGAVFVTPPIGEWVLVAGIDLSARNREEDIDSIKSLLNNLSSEFGEAQFFSTYLALCFAKSINGTIARLYSNMGYVYDYSDIGTPTIEEYGYNLKKGRPWQIAEKNDLAFDENDPTWQEEEADGPKIYMILEIAEKWSINAMNIRRDYNVKGVGILGILNNN